MKNLKILSIVFGLLIASYAFAESQIPSPRGGYPTAKPENRTGQAQKESGENKNPTSNLPSLVEISKTPIIQIDTIDKPEKKRNYSSSEWWLVYFTFLLAIITAALAAYTARLYHATVNLGREAKLTSERQAKEMGKSLEIAATAERAWIGVNFGGVRLWIL